MQHNQILKKNHRTVLYSLIEKPSGSMRNNNRLIFATHQIQRKSVMNTFNTIVT